MRKTGNIAVLLIAGGLLAGCTAFHPPSYNLPAREGIQVGGEVVVEKGQNVYAIANKNGVSMREVIALNNLKPPFIVKPGQTLLLPVSNRDNAPTPSASPAGSVERDSSMGGVESAPVESSVVSSSSVTPSGSEITAVPLEAPKLPAQKPVETTVTQPVEAPKSVATAAPLPLTDNAKAAEKQPSKSVDTGEKPSFMWPVQGPIASNFGSKGQGQNNDGVNISAPKGSPVLAAGAGIVAYAGNEMKGFGNLVLIRHENGWVTAYAHLDRMMVTRDAVVAAGDMIGSVGSTGGVASPQLHFETRLEGKPVDPQTVIKAKSAAN